MMPDMAVGNKQAAMIASDPERVQSELVNRIKFVSEASIRGRTVRGYRVEFCSGKLFHGTRVRALAHTLCAAAFLLCVPLALLIFSLKNHSRYVLVLRPAAAWRAAV